MVKISLNKLSFKQAFVGIMTVSIVFALILSWIISSILTNIYQNKSSKYDSNMQFVYEGEYDINKKVMFPEDNKEYEFAMHINTWIPLIIFFITTILASHIFYNWKMKVPLILLSTSMQKIKDQKLDFSVKYDTQDEMGELIRVFESMRKELYSSFISQWRAQEDSKMLNIAFAHDMRTPLTVLKGQVDVLIKYMKMGNIELEKIIETMYLLKKHVNRIERYTDEMTVLQKIDEICIYKKQIVWNDFWSALQKNLNSLVETEGKEIYFNCNVNRDNINIDEDSIVRIMENIVSNALRYSKTTIIVSAQELDKDLSIKVYDDGPGFSRKTLEHGLEPFYQENSSDNTSTSEGVGFGLYICKILVSKHGGTIALSQGDLGGACINVKFISVF